MSLRLSPEVYKVLCVAVLERDGWKCRRCGYRQNLHVHHIVFRSQMGVDESWNLVTVCSECHDKIHAYNLYIDVAEGNHVGPGGGADGKLIFLEERPC